MNIPKELKYTEEHEWIRIDGNTATIGITDFAQGELGDIVYIDIDSIGNDLDGNEIEIAINESSAMPSFEIP